MTDTEDGPPATRLVRGPDGRWQVTAVTAEARSGASPIEPAAAPRDVGDRPGPPPTPAGDTVDETGPLVRRIALTTSDDTPDRHLVIIGDGGQPVSQLLSELHRLTGVERFHLSSGVVGPSGTIGQIGLRDGVSLGAGSPPDPAAKQHAAGRVIRVVGGADAGHTHPLGGRQLTIGRSASCTIRLTDPAVSRSHVVVRDGPDGVVVHTLDSTNDVRVEGDAKDQAVLGPGDLLRVGDTLLEVGQADDSEWVTLESGTGYEGLHRRFRSGRGDPPGTLRHPRMEEPGEPQPLNLLLALLPAAGIGAIAVIFRRPEILVFAAMSPLLALARSMSSKRSHQRKVSRAEADHAAAVQAFSARLAVRRSEERRYRRRQLPDLARIIEAGMGPTTDLWSRRASDADALTLRVGSASARSTIVIEGMSREPEDDAPDPPDQPWLPVGVSLVESGGLALVGQLDRLRPLAGALVMQAVVLHAPSELMVVFLGGADAESAWSWLRWLPHLRRGHAEPSLLMGTDAGSRAVRIQELRRILARRRTETQSQPTLVAPRILVVYDDASARLGEGVAEILREGSAYGIHALALDSLQVPEGCNASVVLGSRADDARVEQQGRAPVRRVITDGLDAQRCEPVARRLSSIRVVGEDDDDTLPSACRLLTTIRLTPDADHIRARWAAGSPSTRAVIGVGPRQAVSLDLTRDGPHALIAGTTGSGKSEFIKTFVASLVAGNHPDHLSFLFIDFKGGGDYQGIRRLPHTVALTTHLDDPVAVVRTLQMLEAELARRLRMFSAAGINSIEGYQATGAAAVTPLPRLVVVVDEFAELKDKAPQQLDRLVSVARTGRSAGVHLILATQRPAGVVTSQIDANVGLRVCFRVKDEMESKEILDSPLAGRIAERTRGRCYVRSAATPLSEVQTARVAGARPGAVSARPIRVLEMTWEALGRHLPGDRLAEDVPDADTDLADVVAAAIEAATSSGWTANAVPWPAELPTDLHMEDLPAPVSLTGSTDTIPIGLVDVPGSQRQDLLSVRMGHGHVVVAGSGRTGRSSVLRTFLAGVVSRYTPAQAQVSVIDFGGGALLPVEQAPHCIGSAIEDMGRCEAIVEAIENELISRRELFSVNGWADLPAQHAASDTPLPWLVLVIDGWDNLAEEGLRHALTGRIAQLLARGTPQGLQVVMAGDRGTTHSQIARHLTHRYALRFNRSVDAELQGIMARDLPREQPPGRAMEIQTRQLVQFARIDDPSGVGDGVAFQRVMAGAGTDGHPAARAAGDTDEDQGRGPVGGRPTEHVDLGSLGAVEPPGHMTFPLLLGVATERSRGVVAGSRGPVHEVDEPEWTDLADSAGVWFVVGTSGTGRSTTLRTMGLADADADVIVVGPDDSPLVTRMPPGWRRLDLDAGAEAFIPRLDRRLLVLVDDLDALGVGRDDTAGLGVELPGRGVVVAADIDWIKLQFSGLAAAVRRQRAGMVLSPQSTANGVEMFGAGLPPDMITAVAPGRAIANRGAGPLRLQVPQP